MRVGWGGGIGRSRGRKFCNKLYTCFGDNRKFKGKHLKVYETLHIIFHDNPLGHGVQHIAPYSFGRHCLDVEADQKSDYPLSQVQLHRLMLRLSLGTRHVIRTLRIIFLSNNLTRESQKLKSKHHPHLSPDIDFWIIDCNKKCLAISNAEEKS
ncbi:hypothetical protein TNCT_115151 [Trichonephila clavata]|uniref:Uncharacterized protein n=1 Tax=Trichonephila clavata TaxID=2740835 RepID=A0A8X6LEK9_TRICU|nr:hypothetical protein TNCT_115151 [Trichonephila clavata]